MMTSTVSAGRWVRRGGQIILYPAQLQAEGAEQEFGAGATPFVRWVQTMLNLVGGMSLPVSGILDTPTRNGIRQFQQRKGLVADGVVGPRTEAAFVSGGGVPFRLFGTGLPAQVGTPANWVDRCAGVTANCKEMTPEEQARVRARGGSPLGDFSDRTPESSREVMLQLHLTDYDVNDWLVRKPRHREALNRVVNFIVSGTRTPVEVTISGSASRNGAVDVNEELACKRAQCAAAWLRDGLAGKVAPGRVRIDTAGKGFTEAWCERLPDGTTECELPRFRSVLVQVHAPGRKPRQIPVLPSKAFTIQCLDYRVESVFDIVGKTLGDVIQGKVKQLPPELGGHLNKRLKGLVQSLTDMVLKALETKKGKPDVIRVFSRVLRRIPLEGIVESGTFRIAEAGRPGAPSATLCYKGKGVRAKLPKAIVEDLVLALGQVVKFSSEKVKKLVEMVLQKALGAIPDPLTRTTGPGPVKAFAVDQLLPLAGFSGSALMARHVFTGSRMHVAFLSPAFTRRTGRARITKTPCDKCDENVIPLPLASKTRDVFTLTVGSLTAANCPVDRGKAAPRELAWPSRRALAPAW